MSTLTDVAKRAGVSSMTVSRVVNNSGYISQETRERVEAAIVELGYVPNAIARYLRFKQTKTIALILTDITNPFFTTVARGVEDVAGEQGFSVMFCNTDESEDAEREYLNVLLQKQVDGVLLVPAHSSGESIARLHAREVPVVVLDRRVEGAAVDMVRCDSERGAYELTNHLLALGHTRIAILSGPGSVSTAVDRVAGYARAMAETGLVADDHLVFHGDFSEHSGYAMARHALALDPRPTAIFAANNFIAFGAYRTLREAGLEIPQDISLVSFDDLPPPWGLDPFLTVMAQPAYEIGQLGTELLLERLAGEETGDMREILLPTRLIMRQSSAPPGKQ